MEIIKTEFEGLLLFKPRVFEDERGYFFEAINNKKLAEVGFEENLVQSNISKSSKGTIRGLHYQIDENAQGKLCQVIHGKVLDVSVDIRFGSPTFGKHFAVELSEENHHQVWIPAGFAHGFAVLSDQAVFMYMCNQYYSKKDERAILFNDPQLNIDWKVENPIVSEKDIKASLLSEIAQDFIYTKK